MTEGRTTTVQRLLEHRTQLVLAVAALFLLGVQLPRALWRHVHVDEFQNLFNMVLLASGDASAANSLEPYLVGMGYLLRFLDDTAEMLLFGRLLFFGLLVACLALIALVQDAFPSAFGRASVFAVALSCVPFWRHGYEVRHDVFLALAGLVIFAAVRRTQQRQLGKWSLFVAGLVAGLAVLNGVKGGLFLFPALLLLCATRSLGSFASRAAEGARALLHVGAGGAVGLALGAAVLAAAGVLNRLGARLGAVAEHAGTDANKSSLTFVATLAMSAPLVSALAVTVLAHTTYVGLRDRKGLSAGTSAASAFLILALFAIALNPTAYSYNTVWVFPFVFLAAVYGARIALAGSRASLRWALAITVALTFGRGHLYDGYQRIDNVDQLAIIDAAEALTALEDPILDGAGIVATRPPPSRDWLLHSLVMGAYHRGERESFTDIIQRAPPPVALPNYRFSWLSPDDQRALKSAYLPLTPSFMVLGGRVQGGVGELFIRRAGRYLVDTGAGSLVAFDGQAIESGGVVELSRGMHRYETDGASLWFAWVGPHLTGLPRIPNVELFVGEGPVY